MNTYPSVHPRQPAAGDALHRRHQQHPRARQAASRREGLSLHQPLSRLMLVYFEAFGDIKQAIQREKTLKHYVRAWKINLIERENPHWVDLYPGLLERHG